jgi:hypothetical protein
MIGSLSLAGVTVPVFRKTWIIVPPSVSPATLLACAQASVEVPALEPLFVEDLLRWSLLRGMTELQCRDEGLQKAVLSALREDADLPLPLRAVSATAGSWIPGAAEAALEVYYAPALPPGEVVVCPEPGAQVEIALTAAPLRKKAHVVILHYRPPVVPEAWITFRLRDAPEAICAAFDGTEAFQAVYSLYEGDL